jgi:hypothetical protein
MRPKHLSIHIVSVLFALPFLGAFAQEAPSTIQIVTLFDYPLEGVSTLPQKINEAGDIAGEIEASTGAKAGLVRSSNGRFSSPINDPNATVFNITYQRGINDSHLLCGFYLNGDDSQFHGFFESDASFTDFVIPGAMETELYAVNDAGDFCGAYSNNDVRFQAFLSVGGTIELISIRGSVNTLAYGMNNLNEVVGVYIDKSGVEHGFFRDAAGTVTAPVDPPGATTTIVFGVNDRDLIVGRFTDSSGVERGFVLQLPDTVMVLDKPGATLTSLNGINNNNVMCGRVVDSSGVAHGIVARIRKGLAD